MRASFIRRNAGRSGGRLVLRSRALPNQQREPGAALGGDRRISCLGRGHDPRDARHDPGSVALSTAWPLFGLEWTVGISWAVPLDIGGDFAGSVSAVMNTLGNIGGAISPTVVTYAVRAYGWNAPFFVTSALCLIAAACS